MASSIQETDRHTIGVFSLGNPISGSIHPATLVFAACVTREKAGVIPAQPDLSDSVGTGNNLRECRSVSVDEHNFTFDKRETVGAYEYLCSRRLRFEIRDPIRPAPALPPSEYKARNNASMRYALVVTIDAGDVEQDLWAEAAIAAGVEIEEAVSV